MPKERLKIKGLVRITQTDEEGNETVIQDWTENRFCNGMLKYLWTLMSGLNLNHSTDGVYFGSNNVQIYVGRDTVTSTTFDMSELDDPIGVAPGIAPNVIDGVGYRNPATNVYTVRYLGQWFPGTISGTVGEIALYLNVFNGGSFLWQQATGTAPHTMVSRLSNADGELTPFAIDTTKTLTIEWIIRMDF